MNRFLIRGPWDACEGCFLFWSEDDHWTTMDRATPYDFQVFYRGLPWGGSGIVEVTPRNEVVQSWHVVIVDPSPLEGASMWN